MAHHNARRGKSHYTAVQQIDADEETYLQKLQKSLIDKTFTTSEYQTRVIHEPKRRLIYILPYYPDRIVQHAVMNVLRPIWDKVFIHDTYAGIQGKGIHAAIYRLDGFLRDKENTRYCLQFDIKSYYPSVDHRILMALIRRKIKCSDTLWLLRDVVQSIEGDKGIPIGNYLSQYFANIYLSRFDHWLKEDKQCKYYIRYNDDGVILHSNKDSLHDLWADIGGYLETELRLKLNPKTQIYPVNKRGIDFLGYRTFRGYRLLRKRSATKFKRKTQEITEFHNEMDPQHIVSSIMSYVGWLQHGNCYNLLSKYVLHNARLMGIIEGACDELGFGNPLRDKYPEVLDDRINY